MYESGGQMTGWGKGILLFVLLGVAAMIGQYSKFWGNIASLILLSYILYLLLKLLYRIAVAVRATVKWVVGRCSILLDSLTNRR